MAWLLLSLEALSFDLAMLAQRSFNGHAMHHQVIVPVLCNYNYSMTTRVQRLLQFNMALWAQCVPWQCTALAVQQYN